MKSSENHIFVTLVFKMSFFSSISEFLVWHQVNLYSKHWFSILCYHTMLPKHNTINKRWLLPHLSRYLIFHLSSLIDVALSQGISALHRSRTPLDQAMRPLHHPQVGEAVEPRVQSLCHGGCVVLDQEFPAIPRWRRCGRTGPGHAHRHPSTSSQFCKYTAKICNWLDFLLLWVVVVVNYIT